MPPRRSADAYPLPQPRTECTRPWSSPRLGEGRTTAAAGDVPPAQPTALTAQPATTPRRTLSAWSSEWRSMPFVSRVKISATSEMSAATAR